MPRVHHVKKARKDNPAVKAGQPYYWWEFRYGGKRYSATFPKASQLTQSAFLGQVYDLNDRIAALEVETPEDLESELEDIASEFNELGQECQGNLDNMPEALQDSSSSGEMLQERISACEDVASQLEEISCQASDGELEDLLEQARQIQYEGY